VLLTEDGTCLTTRVLATPKVQLSLCIVRHSAMKMYGGEEQQLHGFNFRLEVCRKLKVPAVFTPAQRARGINWIRFLDGPLRLSGRCGESKNLCPCQESNTGSPLTIVTELHRLYTRGEFKPRQTRQLPRAVDLKGRVLFLVVVKC
jgi:hypothetical protein